MKWYLCVRRDNLRKCRPLSSTEMAMRYNTVATYKSVF